MQSPMQQTPLMPNKNNNGKKASWRRQLARLRLLLRSSRGKDFFIFLLFICVSYVFWIIMALNDDTQRDLKLNFEITGIPSDVTFITEVPNNIQVSVRDKGSVLVNYLWSGAPSLKIPYKDFAYDEVADRIVMGELALQSRVRSSFGPSTNIINIRPDSLSLIITNRKPSLARVIPQIEASPVAQCVLSGPITVSPDTVKVYSARHLPIKAREIKTMKVVRSGLRDTLKFEVRLQPESGIRTIPDRVTVTIPVEPLISKTRQVPVALLHAPNPSDIVMFPSIVSVSYLLPMSQYNSENGVISVTADYRRRSNSKIPLTLGALPDYYKGVELNTDSVEYLIEQKANL